MTDDAAVDIERVEGQIIMPFYIICDVSSSMTGDITALNGALNQLHQDIMADAVVDDLVMLSIISFNHSSRTEVALDFPKAIHMPTLTASGGTDYGEAFQEFHRAFGADLDRLTKDGMRMYRPCVFFLSDGEPGDRGTYLNTFKSLFGYDNETGQGNRRFPYVVTFGFRDATEQTMSSIAYPDWGTSKGRWFLAKQGSQVSELLKSMAAAIGNTVLSSGQTLTTPNPRIIPPPPPPGFNGQFGEAGDLM